MKHTLLLVATLWSGLPAVFAQSFAEVGTTWYYSYTERLLLADTEYMLYESVLDTTILGRTTHKVVQTYHDYLGEVHQRGAHYFYEESDTVYVYSPSKNRFLRHLIFTGNVGDTLTLDLPDGSAMDSDSTYQLVIEEVGPDFVDGATVMAYHVSPVEEHSYTLGGTILERVGGLQSFTPWRWSDFPFGAGFAGIRCYRDGQIDANFRSFACDFRYPNSIEEPEDRIALDLFPNPTADFLRIKSTEPVSTVAVLDLLGQTMLPLQPTNGFVDLSKLPAGTYLLQVVFTSGRETTRRIIKQAS